MIKGSEAKITINGVELSDEQSKVVRIAVSNFEREMNIPGVLGNDQAGFIIADRYLKCCNEIIKMIFMKTRQDL